MRFSADSRCAQLADFREPADKNKLGRGFLLWLKADLYQDMSHSVRAYEFFISFQYVFVS